MKPVWVKVEWSESREFKDNELIPFKEFEKRCRKVARNVGDKQGYDKTKCEILFDEGSRYGLRLDLAEDDDHGFEDRAKKTIYWFDTNDKAKGVMDSYVEFLKKIDWS